MEFVDIPAREAMASDPVHLRCFDSFASVRENAAGKLDDRAQPGPFDRQSWFEALHARAFPGGKPLILEARQGAASAWLFLTQGKDGMLHGIANWYSFVFRPQFHGVGGRDQRLALLTAMTAKLRGASHHLRLYPIVDDAQIDTALIARAFRASGWRVITRTMAHKRLLHLPPGTRFADYWAGRPGPLRSTFRRKAQRHPLDIAIDDRIDDALWSALQGVFGASWKPKGDDFPFLRGFAEAEAQAGRLRIGLARIAGAPAAVELWTVEQGHAYIHKLAFAERFADASPGTQLSHAMFAHAIDTDRVTTIDFGTGDNEYKANWMPEAVPMHQIDAFDLRRAASWAPAFTTWLSALSQPDADALHPDGKAIGGRRAALQHRPPAAPHD
jgi:hypothetical protein